MEVTNLPVKCKQSGVQEGSSWMIKSLQSLRALAITSIVLSHCSFIGAYLPSGLGPTGVSAFICLSGFLTYLSLKDKTTTLNIKSATKRTVSKMRKFYPLHIATFVLATPFVIATISGKDILIQDAIKGVANLALLQSWIPIRSVYFSYNAVSWFLSTYLFFIVISPLLMSGSRRLVACKHPLRGASALLIATILCEFVLAHFFGHASYAHWVLYVFPVTRSLDFIAGMLMAFLLTEGMAWQQRASGLAGAMGIIGGLALEAFCIVIDSMPDSPHSYFLSAVWCIPSLLLVASAYIIHIADQSSKPSSAGIVSRLLRSRPLVFLGDISMPLFLVHQLVIRYLGSTYDLSLYPLLSLLLCFGISIMIAAVIQTPPQGELGQIAKQILNHQDERLAPNARSRARHTYQIA